MRGYSWPGNVRELMNCVRYAMLLDGNRLITAKALGLERAFAERQLPHLSAARAERDVIVASLLYTGNNVSEAARRLGVTRATLYRLMAKHGHDVSRAIAQPE
jgi:DNA-binding NtrC family response regulator